MAVSSDLELTRAVRRIFVKHWVDLGRISVRCMSGRVRLHGRLQPIPGKGAVLQAGTVNSMFYELKRLKGVVAVNARLENWINESGRWRPFERHGSKETKD